MERFDHIELLLDQADKLLGEGKDREAALTFALCRQQALNLGDPGTAFYAGLWEAIAHRQIGNLLRAQQLLFTVYAKMPNEVAPLEKWRATDLMHRLLQDTNPELSRLKGTLSAMETMASREPHFPDHLHYAKGSLSLYRGEWNEALDHFSRGWNVAGAGMWRSGFAYWAGVCCLKLGRSEEARSWRDHLSRTEQNEWEDARIRLKALVLFVALNSLDQDRVTRCCNSGCGSSRDDMRAHLFLRGASFDSFHDPATPSHPARKLAKPKRTENVHRRYDNLLALVDYRLACLRFTAGLPSVDDLYYRKPDAAPHISLDAPAKEQFRRQVRLFDISWGFLNRHAGWLDGLLECDWRTKEAESRRQRRDAIVVACGPRASAAKA